MAKIKGHYRKKKVAVLMGGPSGEREVSLRSGQAVLNALKERGYEAESMDAGRNLTQELQDQKFSVAYNALHGTWGEDGMVQALLETAGIPYTGCGVVSSATTMDKIFTKRILMHEELPTPPFYSMKEGDEIPAELSTIGWPLVVKPNRDGSSLGITICKKKEELQEAIHKAFNRDRQILLEKFIPGRELTVGVVEGEALPLVEIVPNHEFYNYEAKYTKGGSNYFCPAKVDQELSKIMMEMALKVNYLFNCRGGIRIDFRLSPKEEPSILEINTSPGMTELSLLPMGAKEAGYSFADLVELILDGAKLEERISWAKVGKK